jgi:hypothetical protein
MYDDDDGIVLRLCQVNTLPAAIQTRPDAALVN